MKSSPKRDHDTTPAEGKSHGGSRPDRDLIAIWLYTAREWGVEQADTYEREIRTAMQSAADDPSLGSPILFGSRRYRKRSSGPHKLIYRATATEVVIVRVIHGAQDQGSVVR